MNVSRVFSSPTCSGSEVMKYQPSCDGTIGSDEVLVRPEGCSLCSRVLAECCTRAQDYLMADDQRQLLMTDENDYYTSAGEHQNWWDRRHHDGVMASKSLEVFKYIHSIRAERNTFWGRLSDSIQPAMMCSTSILLHYLRNIACLLWRWPSHTISYDYFQRPFSSVLASPANAIHKVFFFIYRIMESGRPQRFHGYT